MIDSPLHRGIESFAQEKLVLAELDRSIQNAVFWQPENDELLGSIQRFQNTGEVADGTAFSSGEVIVVEQGSFVSVKRNAKILSPDFARCVAVLSRDHQGIFFAHSTEHELELIDLLRRFGSVDESCAFVPTDPPQELDIDLESRKKLIELRKKLLESGVKVVTYPWSDFPPTHPNANEGYVVSVSHIGAVAMKTALVEDDSVLGYHHERMINDPVISF